VTKPTINRLFIAGLALLVVGISLVLITVAAFLCTATWTVSGTQVTNFELNPDITWTLGFAAVGGVLVSIGALLQFIAWIGALVNTSRLEDKVWFVVLLVTGVLTFGFIAMLVYVLIGPDGTATPTSGPALRQGPPGVQPV
jgi:hypothetical protein